MEVMKLKLQDFKQHVIKKHVKLLKLKLNSMLIKNNKIL